MSELRGSWEIPLFMVLMSVFVALPQIDLTVSGWFYGRDGGFFLRDQSWVRFIHEAIPLIARWIGLALAVILLLGFLPKCRQIGKLRFPAMFLLLGLGLGPGLVVNGVLKEHWGRARPADVHEFGGAKTFTPAFVLTDQCQHNCSFVSGHAAQGFFFCLLGFLARKRIWFAPGLALGCIVGLARIAQGRHFLSDVIFALFAVYFVGKLLRNLLVVPAGADANCGWLRQLRSPSSLQHHGNGALANNVQGSESLLSAPRLADPIVPEFCCWDTPQEQGKPVGRS